MSNRAQYDAYVARVKRIDWQSAPAPTPHAEELLREYARRVAKVWRGVEATRGMDLIDADIYFVEVGNGLPESVPMYDDLYEATRGAGGVWPHLSFNLHAYYFWPTDPELARFENPFEPLLELYELGFTTAGGVSDTEPDKLDMSLGSKAGVQWYDLQVEPRRGHDARGGR